MALFVGIDTLYFLHLPARRGGGNKENIILACSLSCIIEHSSWMFLNMNIPPIIELFHLKLVPLSISSYKPVAHSRNIRIISAPLSLLPYVWFKVRHPFIPTTRLSLWPPPPSVTLLLSYDRSCLAFPMWLQHFLQPPAFLLSQDH